MLRRGERSNRGQGGWLYGDLWTFLRVGLPDDVIKYNSTVTTLGDDPSAPVVEGEAYDVAIVADGGWSTLRKAYFDPAGKGPEYAGYVAWRFKLPTSALSPPFQAYGEYSAGHYTTILLDIIEDKGGDWIMGGTAVSTPESAVARPRAGENRQAGGGAAPAATEDADAAARAHVEWYSSKFAGAARGEAVRVLRAALDHGKVSPIPQFEYCAPRVTAGRLVLVGDAAHMASPRTASGAHTAVLDGAALFDAFAGTLGAAGAGAAGQPPGGWAALVDEALAAYGPGGLARARQLYRRSLEVSAQVMPRGAVASLRRGAAAADTIFALSTPPGRSALALVRVSGPLALTSVARAVLRAPSAPAGAADGPPPLPPRRASVRAVVHPRTGAPLDVGVATAFPGPASATGEDVLELSVHGGRAVVAAVVDALGAVADDVVARGGGGRVRPAEPGEFTRRAYLAGRLDAAQVEGLADLLAADTEAQRRLALASASGALSSAYDGWRRELVSLLAAAEAALEFAADGDVDDAAVAAAARPRVAALLRALRAHAASARAGALVRDGASVVLVGAPNAGKSSLLNALSRRPAAIVAPQPGTTRDALEVPLDLGGLPVTLVDTAGLRGAPADEAEAEGIARARERAARAHVRLALVDAGGLPARGRGGAVRLAHLPPDVAALFAAEGRSAVEGAAGEGAGVRSGGGRAAEARAPDGARPRTLLVLNKCDDDADDDDAPIDADSEREGGRAEPAGAAGGASVRVSARVSCLTGRGVARLLRIVEAEARALASAAGGGGDGDAPVLARARHARHVAACIAALEAWSGEGPAALPPDAAAEELRVAANALASIVAVRVDTEEVLDVLFETFCVGK